MSTGTVQPFSSMIIQRSQQTEQTDPHPTMRSSSITHGPNALVRVQKISHTIDCFNAHPDNSTYNSCNFSFLSKNTPKKAPQLFTKNTYSSDRFEAFLENMQILEIIEASQLLSENASLLDKANILDILSVIITKVPRDHFNAAVEKAPYFFTPGMTSFEKGTIIQVLAYATLDRFEIIIEKALFFLSPDMTEFEKGLIFQALVSIPEDRIDIVIEKTLSLSTSNSTALEKRRLLKVLTHIPEDQLDVIIEKASQFFTENTTAFNKAAIIKTVALIPEDDRDFLESSSPLHSVIKQNHDPVKHLFATYVLSPQLRTRTMLGQQTIDINSLIPSLILKLFNKDLPKCTLFSLAKFTLDHIPESRDTSFIIQHAIEIVSTFISHSEDELK